MNSVAHAPFTVLPLADERYPERLRTIPDPPPVLYCDGLPEPEDRVAIAIVGARQATSYGVQVTEALARDLSRLGFTIVSGMARGIDAAAHRGALAAGGRTIAVLGCGLDVVYPPEHGRLRAEIAQSGSVMTEFPPGTRPLASHFPRRNRILSGLALGVVVVEAAEGSGSLITARLALDQGREVFAVPGPLDAPLSRGPHGLIKQGAKLVETVEDIVEELLPQLESIGTLLGQDLAATDAAGAGERRSRLTTARTPAGGLGNAEALNLSDLSAEEKCVLTLITREPVTIDALTARTGLPPAVVAGALLELELKEVIRQMPGQWYFLVR
jgi:DNA processing protein